MSSTGSDSHGEGRPALESEAHTNLEEDLGQSLGDPDVVLDVPKLNVEEVQLEVEELRVRVSFAAELADLVKINVGLDAELDGVTLAVKGVEAQAQLKARLDNVRAIFGSVLESLEHSPQFFREALQTVNQTTETPSEVQPDVEEPGDVRNATEDSAEEPEATEAARKKARHLGVDLTQVNGSGSGGRILVRDVTRAAKG